MHIFCLIQIKTPDIVINVEGHLCSEKPPGCVTGLLTSGELMHENSLVIQVSKLSLGHGFQSVIPQILRVT